MKNFLILLFLPISVLAQSDKAALVRQFITGQHQYFSFNGNVLVTKGGKIIYRQALGYADYTSRRPLNDSTVFELASVSKQFTAIGIMICQEKGLLRYEDNIKRFFPNLPYDHITVRQLLTHTSGLPSYEDQMEKKWDRKKIAHNQNVLDLLITEKDSLLFQPGSKWMYSNTGYTLLASIIEQVSGLSYHDFMAKNIFQPLGMTHTFIYNTRRTTGKIPSNYALGFVYVDSLKRYILPDSLPALDMVYYLDGIVGDGCVNSTTGDLFTWQKALFGNKLVSQSSKDLMLSPLVQQSSRDTTNFYGFGVGIQTHTPKGKVISHTGGWPGYRTLLAHRVDPDETIIILSNNETNNGLLRAGIESILNGETLVMPYKHKAKSIDPSLLDRYVGKYFAFLTMEFIKKDNKLFRHRAGTPDTELIPESDTKFFYGDGTDRQIEFEVDKQGKVIKTWFINTGQKGELKKID